ncbi:ABC transporter substrate-binding protein [Bradyrhizobium sp. 2]|uniref:ABC transporter substrate-binding protein n=1 Tax=Bradyrhizobium sp. 2 TaxID=190045 RepID=UPI001FF9938E|nr:ABC transporter substrate-binding protein [Bradyrhizobium sp. 2]MCK1465244.1 ABC transporter substrate-binding protein [Bradyrhizobium sp. 2]
MRRLLVALMALLVGVAPSTATSPVRGGTLNYLLAVQPAMLVAFTTDGVRQISPKITEGLLTYDFDLTPRPSLATAWRVSEDGLTYVFTLRSGVNWHDGKPFTAADAAFSILLLKEVHPRGRITFANVASTDTPDDQTLILHLSKPAPYLLNALDAQESPIVPKHIYGSGKADTNPRNNAPIGTGPFRFVELVHGSHLILEGNPNYWDPGKPYLDRIVYRFVNDAAARSVALETGEVDLADGIIIPLSEIERISALPHITIERKGTIFNSGVKRLEFNLDNPILSDLHVRQAIAHAIDKKFIRDVVWYGHGQIVSGPISPDLAPFYVKDLPSYPFDLTKANELLDVAGYKRDASGVRFRLPHDFRPSSDGDKRTAEYVKQALAKIGIDITVRSQDFPSYVRRVYTDRDFAFTTNSMTNTFDPTVGVQRLYWSKNFKPGVPFSNGSHYRNDEVDRLLEAAAVENDTAPRKELLAKFEAIVVRELPDLNLISDDNFSILNKRVVDAVVDASGISGNFSSVYLVGHTK